MNITLGGAASGTLTATNLQAVYQASNTTGALGFSTANAGQPNTVTVLISFSGEPKVATYAGTDTGATGSIIYVTPADAFYATTVHPGMATAGSYTLVFSSVSTTNTDGSGNKTYASHGTLDAVMPPSAGGANATLHATF